MWFFLYPGVFNWWLSLTWIRNLSSTLSFFEQECTFAFCLLSNCWCQIGNGVFRWAGRKEAQFPYKGVLRRKNWWLVGGLWKRWGFHMKRDNYDEIRTHYDEFEHISWRATGSWVQWWWKGRWKGRRVEWCRLWNLKDHQEVCVCFLIDFFWCLELTGKRKSKRKKEKEKFQGSYFDWFLLVTKLKISRSFSINFCEKRTLLKDSYKHVFKHLHWMVKTRSKTPQIVTVDSEEGIYPSETSCTMCESAYFWQFCHRTQTNGGNSQM